MQPHLSNISYTNWNRFLLTSNFQEAHFKGSNHLIKRQYTKVSSPYHRCNRRYYLRYGCSIKLSSQLNRMITSGVLVYGILFSVIYHRSWILWEHVLTLNIKKWLLRITIMCVSVDLVHSTHGNCFVKYTIKITVRDHSHSRNQGIPNLKTCCPKRDSGKNTCLSKKEPSVRTYMLSIYANEKDYVIFFPIEKVKWRIPWFSERERSSTNYSCKYWLWFNKTYGQTS